MTQTGDSMLGETLTTEQTKCIEETEKLLTELKQFNETQILLIKEGRVFDYKLVNGHIKRQNQILQADKQRWQQIVAKTSWMHSQIQALKEFQEKSASVDTQESLNSIFQMLVAKLEQEKSKLMENQLKSNEQINKLTKENIDLKWNLQQLKSKSLITLKKKQLYKNSLENKQKKMSQILEKQIQGLKQQREKNYGQMQNLNNLYNESMNKLQEVKTIEEIARRCKEDLQESRQDNADYMKGACEEVNELYEGIHYFRQLIKLTKELYAITIQQRNENALKMQRELAQQEEIVKALSDFPIVSWVQFQIDSLKQPENMRNSQHITPFGKILQKFNKNETKSRYYLVQIFNSFINQLNQEWSVKFTKKMVQKDRNHQSQLTKLTAQSEQIKRHLEQIKNELLGVNSFLSDQKNAHQLLRAHMVQIEKAQKTLKTDINARDMTIQNLNTQLASLKLKVDQLTLERQNYVNQIKQNTATILQNKTTIKNHQDKIKQQSQSIKTLQTYVESLKASILQLQIQQDQLKNTIMGKQSDILKFKETIQGQNQQLENNKKQLNSKQILIVKLQTELKQKIRLLQQKNHQIDNLDRNTVNQIGLANQKVSTLTRQHQDQINKINHAHKLQIDTLVFQQSQDTSTLLKKQTQKQQTLKKQIQDLKLQMKKQQFSFEKHIQKLNNQIVQVKSSSVPFLSESDLFDYYKDQTEIQFIKREVEKLKQKTIIGCRTVYRKAEKLNPHFFIDGIPNLMVVIKLVNGWKIGGFAQNPIIKSKIQQRGNGIIFNLHNYKCYQLKNSENQKVKPKAIDYQEHFFVWGNSEIRLRVGQSVLYSNFGINNSYYDSKQHQVHDFIGGQKNIREMEMESYELIQVRFEGQNFVQRPWYQQKVQERF